MAGPVRSRSKDHEAPPRVAKIVLRNGTHLLRVEYFKGSTREEVNLEVSVKTPDMPAGTATMFSPSF